MKPKTDKSASRLSECHAAPVKVVGTDEGTNHWECSKCGQPCNAHQTAPADEIDEANKIINILSNELAIPTIDVPFRAVDAIQKYVEDKVKQAEINMAAQAAAQNLRLKKEITLLKASTQDRIVAELENIKNSVYHRATDVHGGVANKNFNLAVTFFYRNIEHRIAEIKAGGK